MSKKKWSFSLIVALFLVGILSTSAFARGAVGQSLTPDGSGGFKYGFINTIGDETTTFTLKVYSNEDGYTTPVYTLPDAQAKTGIAKVEEPTYAASEYNYWTITASDYAFKTKVIYKFVLNDGSVDTGYVYGVLTSHDNLNLASIATNPDKIDVNGSKLYNANHTGTSGAASKGGNKHGFYQNNTNSCASCHQTHTGSDDNLLFKSGTYSTCSACHDGTTGAYNAFTPANADTPNEGAGTFNVSSASTHNGSLHEADGSVAVSAAPGGNTTGDSANSTNWGSEFDCASCHTAHGAGSAAENNLNMDPLGWGSVTYDTTGGAQNGKKFANITVIDTTKATPDTIPTTKGTPYILVKSVVTATDLSTANTNISSSITAKNAADLWYRAGVREGDYILQTYRWNGSKGYVKDFSLWLHDNNTTTSYTKLTGATSDLHIIWRDGFAYGTQAAVDAVTSATISVGIDVETTTQLASLFDSANTQYIYDSGTEMSKYCASCHTDYMSATRRDSTGVYTTAHRHQTASDSLTCLRCHFAHGSDAQIMKDANDETYYTKVAAGMTPATALDYLVDVNPSSALKRYTGMSVCYACHGQSMLFQGNPNVNHKQSTDAAVKAIYGSHAVGDVAGDGLKSGKPGTATRGQ